MLVFLLISAACGVLLLGTMLAGDHDVTDALHADGHGGTDLLTVRSALVFGVGFGAIGTIAMAYGLSVTTAVAAGGASGVVLAWATVAMMHALQAQEGDSTPTAADLVGRSAFVTVAIPEYGYGEVSLKDRAGRQTYRRAYADDEVPYGRLVRVVDVDGDAVRVSHGETQDKGAA